jgi:hypothetical protein
VHDYCKQIDLRISTATGVLIIVKHFLRVYATPHNSFFSIVFLTIFATSLPAMVFDNRYFPLLQYPYLYKQTLQSHATADFFISTGSRAADDTQRDVGVPEILGNFNQSQLSYSFGLAGIASPLPSEYVDGNLPWQMEGKIQSQGFAFSYEQALGCGFSLGVLGLAMRVNSSIDFFFNASLASGITPVITEATILELDGIRRHMLADLGLSCNHVQQAGIGDIETYARWADSYFYTLKLRSINYGVQLGALIPTGVKRNIYEPASVPFGGNGQWGAYASADAEFEIKEDMRVGLLVRGIKRFSRTQIQRMPAGFESQLFGVIVGPARIDPGFTQVFYMYGQWEGIREGFGIRLQYSLVNHWADHWKDEREIKIPVSNLKLVDEHSGWASEYVTLNAFYDFGKETDQCSKPIIRVAWDIPFTLLVAHRFVKSYKVSLGLEFNF